MSTTNRDCGHCEWPTDPYAYQFVGGTLNRRFHPPCFAANRADIYRLANLDSEGRPVADKSAAV